MSVAKDDIKEQLRELQQAIQNDTHKQEEVLQRRLRAEEDIMQCTRETKRRVDLMMENSGVADELQQLGHLLQEERQLSEELNGQASADRYQMQNLRERSECISNKVRHLTAEIMQVKQRLTEAKTRNMAAQALIHAPTRKPKRSQRKPK